MPSVSCDASFSYSGLNNNKISTNSLAAVVLAAGWLIAWLTPTRGSYDLNYVPGLLVAISTGLAACLHAFSGSTGIGNPKAPTVISWGLIVPLLLLLLVIVIPGFLDPDMRGRYPELLIAPVVGLICAVLAILLFDGVSGKLEKWQFDHLLELTIAVGSLLTAWTVCVQAGLLPDPSGLVIRPPSGVVPFSNFFQRNHAALLMSMGLVVLLARYPSGATANRLLWLNKTVRLGASAVLVFSIILTQSRSGLLLAVSGAFMVLIVGRPAGSGRRYLLGVIGVVTSGVGLIQWAVGVFLGDYLAASATHGVVDRFASGEGIDMRVQIMLHGLRQWMELPVFGGGWGSHPGWLFVNALDLSWPRFSTHTHNLVSQLLAETGLIGALPVLAALAAVAVQCWRCQVWQQGVAGRMHFVLVTTLVMHSMVEYPLWNLFFLIPFLWSTVRLLQMCSDRLSVVHSCRADSVGLRRMTGWLGLVLAVSSTVLCKQMIDYVDQRVQTQQEFAAGRGLPADVKAGVTYFADVLRYANPVSSQTLAAERLPIGERLVATTPMDWIIERLAIDQALVGRIDDSVISYRRLCAMYRHRCGDVLERLDVMARQVPVLAEVHRRLQVIRRGEGMSLLN